MVVVTAAEALKPWCSFDEVWNRLLTRLYPVDKRRLIPGFVTKIGGNVLGDLRCSNDAQNKIMERLGLHLYNFSGVFPFFRKAVYSSTSLAQIFDV